MPSEANAVSVMLKRDRPTSGYFTHQLPAGVAEQLPIVVLCNSDLEVPAIDGSRRGGPDMPTTTFRLASSVSPYFGACHDGHAFSCSAALALPTMISSRRTCSASTSRPNSVSA